MIDIKVKKDCCGCSACVQICPKGCISLKEDIEGFLYPEADKDICIDCGLCEKVCPFINVGVPHEPVNTFAAKNKDESVRMESSSGGIFTLLAEKVIQEGGVVFGARFDENWEVVHDYTEKVSGLSCFSGSKYVQSRIGDTYRQAETFLKQGRKVMFTGTPCQIRGLKLFLRKDYENLLTVDFICHGVPSPGIWRMYLNETFRKPDRREGHGKNTVLSSSKAIPVITGISFRDKKLGWKKFSFVVRGMSAGQADKNSVLLSDIHLKNPFMRAFLSDLILRPSCYECKAKAGRSGSDITIADFWGVQNILPEFDDDKGVSLLLVNENRDSFVDVLDDIIKQEINISVAKQYNGGFSEKTKPHPKRTLFFSMIGNGDLLSTINETLKIPLVIRLKRKVGYIYRKIIKK